MNDETLVKVPRDVLERAVVFLQQYDVQLQNSIYPNDKYKHDSIEDIIKQIERACR